MAPWILSVLCACAILACSPVDIGHNRGSDPNGNPPGDPTGHDSATDAAGHDGSADASDTTGGSDNRESEDPTDPGGTLDLSPTPVYLKAQYADIQDFFGTSVSLDGDVVAVGACYEDSARILNVNDPSDNSAQDSGAVYIFTRSGTAWDQRAFLKASNADAEDLFGWSVSLDGTTLAVGAYREQSNATGVNHDQTDNSLTIAGAVYVFVGSGQSWSQQVYLKASNTDSFDNFGSSVSLDGDTLAVAAIGESSNATGINGDQANNLADSSGAVYVFVRNGTNWSQQAYLKASNTDADDLFGWSISLNGDTLAVGAVEEDSASPAAGGSQGDNSVANSGAVYVFVRNGTSWSQQAFLKASNAAAEAWFGSAVSLSGNTLAVGADAEDSAATGVNGDQHNSAAVSSGAVYVFTRTGGIWSQQAYLKASNTDAGDNFGISVSLDGNFLAVGAYGEDSNTAGFNGNQADNSYPNSGAVYVFARTGATWSQQIYLKADHSEAGDVFGNPVSLKNGSLVVGSSREDSSSPRVGGSPSDNLATDSGAVLVY